MPVARGERPTHQREIFLSLSAKWLAKAPHDLDWARLKAELEAMRRPPSLTLSLVLFAIRSHLQSRTHANIPTGS
jgi:hypothetical protein